jgi:hypothetical protein
VLDRLVQDGLITLAAIMEVTKVDNTALTTILAAMKQIRERRAIFAVELEKLDSTLVGLEDLASKLKAEPQSSPSLPDSPAPDPASSAAEISAGTSDAETEAQTTRPESKRSHFGVKVFGG